MLTVKVWLKKKLDYSYNIHIGSGILTDVLVGFIKDKGISKIGLVTDSNLKSIYFKESSQLLKDVDVFTFPAGERSKNINTVLNLLESLLKAGFDRKSLLIAFGGGVTGDIAGFLASIYMRGIPFIQVPTSLLAMVDSSIGGKTGVDTEFGKNLIGTFFQPQIVIIDTLFLKTLPELEIINGMAEIIKHAIIMDSKYFCQLEEFSFTSEGIDSFFTQAIIKRSCEIKGSVVSKDEKESGLRQILNFGHTIGHGFEKLSDYNLSHGICVAIGMLVEANISRNLGILPEADFRRIKNILDKFGYLNYINEVRKIDFSDFYSVISSDKKNVKGGVRFVIIERIGKVYSKNGQFSFEIAKEDIKKYLYEILEI
ncbi:MAG: 3-dehydroquinate synthase [Brevinematia bacterium]